MQCPAGSGLGLHCTTPPPRPFPTLLPVSTYNTHIDTKVNFVLQVRDLVEKCTCPSQFPMVRVSEGKYRIGDTKVLIFVRVSMIRSKSCLTRACIEYRIYPINMYFNFSQQRQILRSHVMVRVGGGWDTLSHYLDKHDPCRCRAQHRSSITARLLPRNSSSNSGNGGIELHNAQVIYER